MTADSTVYITSTTGLCQGDDTGYDQRNTVDFRRIPADNAYIHHDRAYPNCRDDREHDHRNRYVQCVYPSRPVVPVQPDDHAACIKNIRDGVYYSANPNEPPHRHVESGPAADTAPQTEHKHTWGSAPLLAYSGNEYEVCRVCGLSGQDST